MEDLLPTVGGVYAGNVIIRGYNPMNTAFYTNLGVQVGYSMILEDMVMNAMSGFNLTENVEIENALVQAVSTAGLLYGVRTFTGDNVGMFPIAVEAGLPALADVAYDMFMKKKGGITKDTIINGEHSMEAGKVKA